MEASWERYLWKHNLLALDPLLDHVGSLRLLDILVKDGKEAWHRRPTVCRVGSMCAFRSEEDDHPGWATTKSKVEQNLEQLVGVKCSTSGDIFRKEEQLQSYDCNSSSGCGILGSITSLFMAGGKESRSVRISIKDVVYEMVQPDWLHELVLSRRRNAPPEWKPDVSRIKIVSRGADDSENLELWIVTELKYGKKIHLNQDASWGASAVVDSSVMTGIPASAGVTVSSTRNGGLVASGRSPIPFAFKAIRLVYDKEGGIIKREKECMGKRRPKKRSGDSTTLEADSDPLDHMGGLFFRAPEGEGNSSKDVYVHDHEVKPLRFVGTNEEMGSTSMS